MGATCKPGLSVSLHGASIQRLRTVNSPILQVALMIPSYLRPQFRNKRDVLAMWNYMCTGRNGQIEFLLSSSNPPMIGVPNWTHAHMGMDQSHLYHIVRGDEDLFANCFGVRQGRLLTFLTHSHIKTSSKPLLGSGDFSHGENIQPSRHMSDICRHRHLALMPAQL